MWKPETLPLRVMTVDIVFQRRFKRSSACANIPLKFAFPRDGQFNGLLKVLRSLYKVVLGVRAIWEADIGQLCEESFCWTFISNEFHFTMLEVPDFVIGDLAMAL